MIRWFSNCVEEAFGQTKALLWPFKKKVWLSLLFLNLLTGGVGGVSSIRVPPLFDFWGTTLRPVPKVVPPSASSLRFPKEFSKEKFLNLRKWGISFLKENKKSILTLGGILLLLVGILCAMWVWIYSRLKMVLIKCLLTKSFYLRRFWGETQVQGDSLFWFNLLYLTLLVLPLLAIPFLGFRSLFHHTFVFKEHWLLVLLVGMASLFYGVVMVFILSGVNRFLPIYMGVTGQGAWGALRQAKSLGPKKIIRGMGILFLYGLFAIGVGIAMSIILVVIVAALAIIFGVAILAGGLLVKFLGVSKLLLLSIGFFLALPFVMVVSLLITVPAETLKNYVGIRLVETFHQ